MTQSDANQTVLDRKNKLFNAKKTGTIDIEPTWESLCNLSERGGLSPKELMQACKIADMVRQAQKQGAKSVTFSFPDKNTCEVEVNN